MLLYMILLAIGWALALFGFFMCTQPYPHWAYEHDTLFAFICIIGFIFAVIGFFGWILWPLLQ